MTATPGPAITLVKSADPTTVTAAGQTVTYSFVVTNTGNVTLDQRHRLTETAFTGTGTRSGDLLPGGAASLAPARQIDVHARLHVRPRPTSTPASVTNTATATGTPPPAASPRCPHRPPRRSPSRPHPALTVVKSADAVGRGALTVGQTVTYSFVVTNTGNVTLTDVTVTEDRFTGSGTAPAPTCPAGAASLAPGAQVTCTATYTVTQADVDAGTITNTATATGTPPTGPDHRRRRRRTVDRPGNPARRSPGQVGRPDHGRPRPVRRSPTSFLVTNTGNVTLTTSTVTETAFTGTGTAPTPPARRRRWLPARHDDLHRHLHRDAGRHRRRRRSPTPPRPPHTATGRRPPLDVAAVGRDGHDRARARRSPGQVGRPRRTVTAAGQTVTYSFVVTNTGNVTLTDVGRRPRPPSPDRRRAGTARARRQAPWRRAHRSPAPPLHGDPGRRRRRHGHQHRHRHRHHRRRRRP